MREVRRLKHLRIVGTVNLWFIPVFVAFIVWVGYLRVAHQNTAVAYLFLYLVPLAAGTGLLTAGRRGNLDLLFGCGVTRSGLWWFTLRYALGIPMLMSLAVLATAEQPRTETTLRAVAALAFTLGISFSAGLVETRYFAGVISLIARMVYFGAGGMTVLKQLDEGARLPSPLALCIAAVAAPESVIGPKMPLTYVIASACVGIAAVVCSYCVFVTADLGGKRT